MITGWISDGGRLLDILAWDNDVERHSQVKYKLLDLPETDHQAGNGTSATTVGPTQYTTGYLLDSYGSILFNSLLVLPAKTELGGILTPVTKEFSVWNAGYIPQTVNSLTQSGVESLSFSQWLEPPVSLQPFESYQVVFSAVPDGPPSLNGEISYTGDLGAAAATITGTRVIGFLLRHDWTTPVEESSTWEVEDLTSYNGTSQRQMKSTKPRVQMTTQHLVWDSNRRLADSYFWGNIDQGILVPLYQDVSLSTAHALSGTKEIFCDTLNRRFTAGKTIMLMAGENHAEPAEIEQVLSDRLILRTATQHEWPARTHVMPAAPARLSGPVRTVQIHPELQRIVAQWDVLDMPAFPPLKTGETPTAALRGQSSNDALVYTREPDFSSPLSEAIFGDFISESFPLAVVDWRENKRAFPVYSKEVSWTLPRRTAVAQHIAWLQYLQGSYNDFFLPTFTYDLKLVSAVVEGALDQMSVESVDFSEEYSSRPGRGAVRVQYWNHVTRNPESFIAGIIESSTAAGVDNLRLDGNLPSAILPENVARTRISFVFLGAMASNTQTIRWRTPVIAEHSAAVTLRYNG